MTMAVVAAVGWVLALTALVMARRAMRRVAMLTQMYWELKYDHGELKARVKAMAGDDGAPVPPQPPSGFVPLSDVKKRS